ncbi:MAG: hypothetical protein PWQ43_282 [Rikenellaceae bacterium]|nr:hypothetical protein [Rikenellaceae bacterium]
MCNDNQTPKTTFWEFLNNHKIEIPIIQRDYAQGRLGKEKLREKFLTDLKNALDTGNPLKLDFVYGNVENDGNNETARLNPLDGQQRLTTLWLLHWYIAFKAGNITDEEKTVFKKFTYETRSSSREFCEKLADFDIVSNEQSNTNISQIIQNQTWFYSGWKQDPTIQSMLNMLSGTPIKDKKGDNIKDGIEEIFEENFLKYWDILKSPTCPIIFYYLDIKNLNMSDDLYIKMNARGKQLTNFENFKAEFENYIKENNESDKIKPFSNKIDTTWTDFFWKFRSNDSRIDEIYYAFINRYFLNCLLTAKNKNEDKTNSDDYLYNANVLENDRSFKNLYGENGNDSNVQFTSFDSYKNIIKTFGYTDFITNFETFLDNLIDAFKDKNKDDINNQFLPPWAENNGYKFSFIPIYKEDNSISTLNQQQRVVFYAMCRYFEEGKYEENSFNKWKRVVWNIVENANIVNIQSMINTMREIDKLSKDSHNIYDKLKNLDVKNTGILYEQLKEEKEKANKILEPGWESKIIEAEKYAFFHGSIRFLFRKDPDSYDWNNFDMRFEKAKKYFFEKVVQEDGKSSRVDNGVSQEYREKSILLRALISKFEKIEHFQEIIYDNSADTWKKILTDVNLSKIINEFFEIKDVLNIDFYSFESQIKDNERLKNFQYDLCKSTITEFIYPNSYLHFNYNKYSLFPYNTKSQSKIFVLGDKRNEVFDKLERDKIVQVDNGRKVVTYYCNPKIERYYYNGWDIYFSLYNNSNKKFQWTRYDKLFEIENGKSQLIREVKSIDELEEYLKSEEKT